MLLSAVWMLSAGEASAEFTAAAREIEGNGGRLSKSLHSVVMGNFVTQDLQMSCTVFSLYIIASTNPYYPSDAIET